MRGIIPPTEGEYREQRIRRETEARDFWLGLAARTKREWLAELFLRLADRADRERLRQVVRSW